MTTNRKKQHLTFLSLLGTLLLLLAVTLLPGCLKKGSIPGAGLPLTIGSDQTYDSPAALAPDGNGGIYVADATACSLRHFDADGKLLSSYSTGEAARAVLTDGGSVFALAGDADGKLLVLSDALKLKKTVSVGHTPVSMALADGKLLIANRFDGSVSIVDPEKYTVTATVAVGREPMTVAIAGGKGYIGCFLPEQTLDAETVAAKIAVLDLSTGTLENSILLPGGSTGVHGLCASPDGSRLYCTHILSRYAFPTTQLDRGWVNTAALTVVDTADGETVTFLLDGVENGAANPWDVEVTPDGQTLYISIAGKGEIEMIRLEKLQAALDRVAAGKDPTCPSLGELCNTIPFLQNSGALLRVSLGAQGLRDLALSGDSLYAACYFDGQILKLDPETITLRSTLKAGEQPEADSVRKGEILWYNANACYQGWESCSSCHPEGRCDGLNWDEAGDGYGTPKNTKSMIYAHRTPPSLATGLAGPAENNVYESIRGVYCNGALSAEEISCVDDYLRSLRPVESPYLSANGGYSEAALRGKALFESAGCAECHPAPLYTDLQTHPSPYIGSDGGIETREMATPTLIEIWRSAPYGFTGRIADVREVIGKFAPQLNESEIEDLRKFVLSIGQVEEQYGAVEVYAADANGKTVYNELPMNGVLTALTLQKQAKDAPDARVKVALCAPDGSLLGSAEGILKDLPLGGIATQPLDLSVGTPAVGSYLEITIVNASGKPLATPLRLLYRGGSDT